MADTSQGNTAPTPPPRNVPKAPWKADTKYRVGDTITSDSGYIFKCTTPQTSGKEAPLFPLRKSASVEGWINIGKA